MRPGEPVQQRGVTGSAVRSGETADSVHACPSELPSRAAIGGTVRESPARVAFAAPRRGSARFHRTGSRRSTCRARGHLGIRERPQPRTQPSSQPACSSGPRSRRWPRRFPTTSTSCTPGSTATRVRFATARSSWWAARSAAARSPRALPARTKVFLRVAAPVASSAVSRQGHLGLAVPRSSSWTGRRRPAVARGEVRERPEPLGPRRADAQSAPVRARRCRLLGHARGVEGTTLHLAPDAHEGVSKATRSSAMIIGKVDDYIARRESMRLSRSCRRSRRLRRRADHRARPHRRRHHDHHLGDGVLLRLQHRERAVCDEVGFPCERGATSRPASAARACRGCRCRARGCSSRGRGRGCTWRQDDRRRV